MTSALGLLFLFINLIDVAQIVPLYAFLEVRLPANLGSLLRQLFHRQGATLYEGYADLFRGARRLLFLSAQNATALSANFLEHNVEKLLALLLSCVVFWAGARLTERRLDNCAARLAQKAFACKLYTNCANSYLSVQTRLAFTGALVLWDLCRNAFSAPLLPFQVVGLVAFLCVVLLPFVHLTKLRNTVRSASTKTKDSYYGASKWRTSSLALVLSKTLFGPFVAASIVFIPTVWALWLIGLVCLFNVIS